MAFKSSQVEADGCLINNKEPLYLNNHDIKRNAAGGNGYQEIIDRDILSSAHQ